MSEIRPWDCEVARRAIHRRLDGEPLAEADARDLAAHLQRCGACGEFDSDLRAIQSGLREIPLAALPDAALQSVLDRTLSSRHAQTLRFGLDWRLAAAAVVTVAVIGLWQSLYPPAPRPSDVELERAAVETRAVLRLTARALRRAERTATRDVLAGEVSPALRRVPINWPSAEPSAGGGRPEL